MNIKDSLLTPKTSFPMKGNLAVREVEFLKNWEEKKAYERRVELNKNNEKFVLLDGPPYANGKIHIGHIENKVLKDIINRSKSMEGFDVQPIFGWDTHGLPIENALLKNKKIKVDPNNITEFREACRQFAVKQINEQREGFVRFGLFAQPEERFYVTYDKEYEAEQLKVFSEMALKGLIYKGAKPIYWSPTSQSALADAEIEYEEKTSPAIFVGFDFVNKKIKAQIVIWTTTPWTIPANRGVAIGRNIEYVKVTIEKKEYILAEALVNDFAGAIDKVVEKTEHVSKESLLTEELIHPLFHDIKVPIFYGDHVTTDAGSGAVHTAPGHGEDDYLVGLENNLEIVSVLDHKGVLNENARQFDGLYYDDAQKEITAELEKKGNLIHLSFIKHSYPHDWRTKKPVVYRATSQWFASIDKIRQEILDSIEDVKWANNWGSTRLHNMIRDRIDWCISRQRKWGVPIPIIYNEDKSPIIEKEVFDHIIKLVEEHGSGIWYELEAKELLPEGYTNEKSPNNEFYKEKDIMDVWFDSGTAHRAVGEKRHGVYPVDLVLEGSDQYRGWFNSMLVTGVATRNKAPYKEVLSHGFTMDGKGMKMSKSVGNTIDPEKMVKKYGADIVRLWVANSDYQADTRISDDIMKQTSELYRRIRNGYRFMLGNLFDFPKDYTPTNLSDVDSYILTRLKMVQNQVIDHYNSYRFKDIVDTINNFFNYELSSFYFDFIKDILYIEKDDDEKRRNTQYVLYKLLLETTKLFAPILPFTTNEVYQELKGSDEEFVFLENLVKDDTEIDENLVEKYTKFLQYRDTINKELEIARQKENIGKSLEAKVTIVAPNEEYEYLQTIEDIDLLMIVSKVEIKKGEKLAIEVEKYSDYKCERCWKYYTKEELNDLSICANCEEVLEKYNGE